MPSIILSLCSRVESHTQQRIQLEAAVNYFNRWDDLLFEAETHGMGPLLYKHLQLVQGDIPTSFMRGLKFLCLRHKQANAVLMDSLYHILEILQKEGIPCLILKGAALCQTLYPEISLRPMRDIDLLFSKEDVQQAHMLIKKSGYCDSDEILPEGYYHLPPLLQKRDGMQVCIELHQGIFPSEPPYYQEFDFSEIYKNSHVFTIKNLTAHTLAAEEMLWHLYQHGFHAPLTYESFKLISVADVVSLVEKKGADLDWLRIKDLYPLLFKAMPFFHYLTPWNDNVVPEEILPKGTVPAAVGASFLGWPKVKIKGERKIKSVEMFKCTFWPSQWWMKLYYGVDGLFESIWCRIIQHPIHILRWVKIYCIQKCM